MKATHGFCGTRENGGIALIDVATLNISGEWVGAYGGRTLEQTREEYADACVVTLEEYGTMQDAQYRRAVSEITADEYDYALCVLPPEGWTRDERGASFKCSGRSAGSITNIYAAVGGRYYALADDFTMPHDEIMRRVSA